VIDAALTILACLIEATLVAGLLWAAGIGDVYRASVFAELAVAVAAGEKAALDRRRTQD
jgi:hypothetical protein